MRLEFVLTRISLVSGLSSPGTLGLFSFFNLLAWVLVFLFVEETRRISLEDLDFIYSVPKTKFWKYQVYEYLPWVLRKYSFSLFRRRRPISDDASHVESVTEKPQYRPRPQLYKPPDYCDDQLDGGASDMEIHTLESFQEGDFDDGHNGGDHIGHTRHNC